MLCSKCSSKTIIIVALVVVAIVTGAFFILNNDSDKNAKTTNSSQNMQSTSQNNSVSPAKNTEDIHSSPEALIHAYFDALNHRDVDAFYNVIAEPVCQEKEGQTPNTPDYYKSYMDEFDRFYGADSKFSIKINEVEYGAPRDDMYTEEYIEDVAFISYDLTVTREGDSQTTEQFMPCTKIDGKWYTDD